ncbi:arabinogalactan peptide 23-like protein [Corchorus capsularis]|uniref:Arabinogalactan peptide 23-like protein n=1 Tax=Corchorus capsularis TaxID=210143 RepID=A0A1R3GYJ0_COCAP|nr:arabinogalactan peptide 23-like protein [Corchorus capsularis]
MDMKKISCAVIVAAASMSAALAAGDAPAAAPGPASDAASALPVIGSVVGASLVSFLAYYLQAQFPVLGFNLFGDSYLLLIYVMTI